MMPAEPKKKSLWPYGLIAFFVVFISWIAVFIGIAVSHSSHLVGADYYEQEIRYQERIDAINRLNGLTGFQMQFDPATGRVNVRLPDEHTGEALQGTFKFYRPDDATLDRVEPVQPTVDGRQELTTAGLKAGNWKLEASWRVRGEMFFARTNLLITAR